MRRYQDAVTILLNTRTHSTLKYNIKLQWTLVTAPLKLVWIIYTFFLIHSLQPNVEFTFSLSQNENYFPSSDYLIINNMMYLILFSLYLSCTKSSKFESYPSSSNFVFITNGVWFKLGCRTIKSKYTWWTGTRNSKRFFATPLIDFSRKGSESVCLPDCGSVCRLLGLML